MNIGELEFDITNEMISIGLAKAADSLSILLREQIYIQNVRVELKLINEIKSLSQKESEKITVITTDLKGDVSGQSFLIFDDKEVQRLNESFLLKNLLEEHKDRREEMSEAFLVEVDNIVCGSVITQLSNLLSAEFYGDVPVLNKYDDSILEEKLREKITTMSHIVYVNVNIVVEGLMLCPEFIWAFNDNFIKLIKEYTKKHKERVFNELI